MFNLTTANIRYFRLTDPRGNTLVFPAARLAYAETAQNGKHYVVIVTGDTHVCLEVRQSPDEVLAALTDEPKEKG